MHLVTAGNLTATHPPPYIFLFLAATLSSLITKTLFPSPLLRRRRTLQPPAMLPAAHLRRTSPIFSSPQSLSDYLSPLLPPNSLSSWGSSPCTKTLSNLFIEISSGETSLLLSDDHPPFPLRSLHVAVVKIRNSRGDLLVESDQLLSDGTTRHRGRPLSEKMLPGERVEEAAVRAVEEELGIGGVFVTIVEGSYVTRVEERDSVSYPGLRARYVLHEVEARVEGLAEEGEFESEEGGEGKEEERVGGAVFVRRHFWKWVGGCDGGE